MYVLTYCTIPHRLQSDTDKWRPLLVDKFRTWFADTPLRFWPRKKNPLELSR